MRKLLYIFLLWPILAWAAWVPNGYQSVVDPDSVLQPTGEWKAEHQTRVGGELMFFDSSAVWKPIRNGWTVTGSGVNRHWVSNGDVLKVDVAYNGTTTFTTAMNGISTILTHKPNRIILENQQTGAITTLAGLTFGSMGAPTVIGDTLRYNKFGGQVVYEIIKKNACVQHRITFNPTCLSAAVNAFNLLPYQPDIALSVESDYSFTNIAQPTGTVYETTLKDFGNRYMLLMDRQWAEWTDKPDSLSPESVSQNWLTGKMRERVMMPKVSQILGQNPNAKIWHNDQVSIGAAGIEDAHLDKNSSNNNYGALTTIWVHGSTSVTYNTIIRVLDVDGIIPINATISACVCSLYCTASYETNGISSYRVFKPWVEGDETGTDNDDGDVTWNDWASDAYEWGKAGCDSANDVGVDNSGDGTGADRKATAESSISVTNSSVWYSWTISTALAQGWYSLTMNENGILLKCNEVSTYSHQFASTENATAANRPRFSFTFSTGGAPAAAQNAQIIVIEE